jgi:hypothetical protein
MQTLYAQKEPGKIEIPNITTDPNSVDEEDQETSEDPNDLEIENQESDKSSEEMSNQTNPTDKPILDTDRPWKLAVRIQGTSPTIDPQGDMKPNAAEAAEINDRFVQGEFQYDVYVNGKKYNLEYPGYRDQYDIRAVKNIDIFSLPISAKLPLSVMTVGYEMDECPGIQFPKNIEQQILNALSASNSDRELTSIQKDMNDKINSLCQPGQEKNDHILYINKIIPYSEYSQCVSKSCRYTIFTPEGPDGRPLEGAVAITAWMLISIYATPPPSTDVIEK